jgi:ADP-ribose pyrophosphatase
VASEGSSARTVFEGRLFRVEQVEVDGSDHPWDVVRHPGSAGVLALTSQDDVLLVEQSRPAIGGRLREIPAGVLDVEGEDALSCAARELLEETGYRHETIEFLGGCYTSPGFVDEYVHLFVATTGSEPIRDREPGVELVRVSFDELVRAARAGRIRDAKTALAVLLAEARRSQR